MNKTIRKKRSNTKTATIEKKHGRDFGIYSDKKLENYIKEQGYPSLSKLLRDARS